MSALLRLQHRTIYRYARSVQLGPQVLRLHPLPDPQAAPPAYSVAIDPTPLTLHHLLDLAGNQVARFALAAPTARLAITVTVDLDLAPRNPFDFVLDAGAARWPLAYPSDPLLTAYLAADADPVLAALRGETAEDTETVTLLRTLTARIRDRIAYIVREEQGTWSPARTLAEGRGSCRDSAWLLVTLLRMHGIAARFVSGYLVQRLDTGDAAELHAWAQAYLPGAGWIGLDPTSGAFAAEGHIALAAAPDPAGAAPLVGTSEPAEAELETTITVGPVP